MTLKQAIDQAQQDIPRRDAELLLMHALHQGRAWMLAHPEVEVDPATLGHFQQLVARRAQHWPLQYLTESQEFYGLRFAVTPDVLIPRPETELLVEAVLHWAGAPRQAGAETPLHIADVGTGSGAIAVTLALHLPAAEVIALDVSPRVRPVVQQNAHAAGVQSRVRFLESDLLSALESDLQKDRKLDAVVSNPPYVALADVDTLQPEVRDFEPHLALFAGQDGLAVYRRLIPQAWNALRSGGLLALEFGFDQQPALEELLQDWKDVRFQQDYAGIPRVGLAMRP